MKYPDIKSRRVTKLIKPTPTPNMPFGTGAGKGDLPRPVDGSQYRSNYENIFRKPKLPETTPTTPTTMDNETTPTTPTTPTTVDNDITFKIESRLVSEDPRIAEFRFSDRPDEVFSDIDSLKKHRGLTHEQLMQTFTLVDPQPEVGSP